MSHALHGATETAVVVPVPEAEPVVGVHRQRLDASAALGVPAHVTVLYPFVLPSDVDTSALERLAGAIATVRSFDCTFPTTAWFGEDVLWLAPEPAEPFRVLTEAVAAAFPSHSPYGGAFDEVIPHLTVAERRLADLATLRAVEQVVQPLLPVATRVTEVRLIAGRPAPDTWRVVARFPLAG